MSLQTVVDDVKGRVESLTAQGQKLAQISLDTLKQVNGIVVDKFQALVDTQTGAAKDLYASAKTGIEKARADGFKAVASAPISYLPPKDKIVTVFNDTVTLITGTGEELYKTVKTGFGTAKTELTAKPVTKKVKAAAKKTAKTVRKAAASAAKAA
jgi:hypothetical protein